MKIIPISKSALTHKYFNIYDKNNHSNKNSNMLSFSSATYSSGTYSDEEVCLAKKYIGKHNWQDEYREKRLEELMKDFNDKFEECTDIDGEHWAKARLCVLFWPVTLPVALVNGQIKENKANEKIDNEIRRISALIIDLNNEQLKQAKRRQIELKKQEKILERKNAIHNKLNNDIVQPLQLSKNDSDATVPTAVMIFGGTKSDRDDAINWIKSKIDSRVVPVDLPQDESDALYRIETEIDYANSYYSKNKVRTVLFVENFDYILNPENVSSIAIADMKELMSSISKDKAPVTIIFQTNNKSKINDAFIGNEIRIPCKINLDEIK